MLRKKKEPEEEAVEEQLPTLQTEEHRRLRAEVKAAEVGVREASEAYRRAVDKLREKDDVGAAAADDGKKGNRASLSSIYYRIKSQERDVERAISEFEEGKEKLHRKDGSRRYSDREHAERLERLTGELSERVEGIAQEAEKDA